MDQLLICNLPYHTMRDPIYYPTFEVKDPSWLKFALLFFEHLKPIIPESASRHLSPEFRWLRDNSDFLQPHIPAHSEAEIASLDAVNELEGVLEAPERFAHLFGQKDFLQRWRNPSSRTQSLFEEKFSQSFLSFVINNNLAHHDINGVSIAHDLADLYMTIFAHALSESIGKPPITDSPLLDRFGWFVRKADSAKASTNVIAQSLISVSLPKNWEQLSLDSILAYRQEPAFHDKQLAFRSEVEKYHDLLEHGDADQDFFKMQGSLITDISQDMMGMVGIGSSVVSGVLSTWVALAPQNLGTLELTTAGVSAGAAAVGTVVGIRSTWKSSTGRRLTRKFLADLRRLT